MTILEVRIDPIDPLLFGDNRSARVADDHYLRDQDPSPATLYGAIGGRIAAALGVRGRRGWHRAAPVLGRFEPRLCLKEGGSNGDRHDGGGEGPAPSQLLGYALHAPGGELWFPRPLVAPGYEQGDAVLGLSGLRRLTAHDEDRVTSLPHSWSPLRPGGDSGPQVPVVKEVREGLLLSRSLLTEVLTGTGFRKDRALGLRASRPEALYRPEVRPGLAMSNASGTAVEGRLFSRPYRRFSSEVAVEGGAWRTAGFTAWLRVHSLDGRQPESFSGVGFLGGDRRRARFTFSEAPTAPLPELRAAVLDASQESYGFFVYLLTPAVASAANLACCDRQPVAAALGHPRTVSGWKAASSHQGPRPIRTLVPAGSCYLFEWNEDPPEARRKLLQNLWLTPLAPAYPNAGFGRILPGVWKA